MWTEMNPDTLRFEIKLIYWIFLSTIVGKSFEKYGDIKFLGNG